MLNVDTVSDPTANEDTHETSRPGQCKKTDKLQDVKPLKHSLLDPTVRYPKHKTEKTENAHI